MTCWGKRGSEPVFPPGLQARSVLPHDLASPRGLMEAGAPGSAMGLLYHVPFEMKQIIRITY